MRLWLWREGLRCRRQLGQVVLPFTFFVMFACLFPLTIGSPTVGLSQWLAPVVWIGWLLAAMLSTDRLFLEDVVDGHWLQWQLRGCDLNQVVLAKMISYWLNLSLPIMLCLPCLALIYQATSTNTLALCLALLLGTPTLNQLVVLLSALLVATQQRQLLCPLLLLPLALPIIVLGISICQETASNTQPDWSPWLLMGGLSLISTALVPISVVSILKDEVRY